MGKFGRLISAAVLLVGMAVVVPATAASAHLCPVRTDQPHYSGHVPGNVNVISVTECSGGWVWVGTDLYRERWYGLQWLASNSGGGTNYVKISTNWTCQGTGTYTYDAYSRHTAGAHPGSSYYTGNSGTFNC